MTERNNQDKFKNILGLPESLKQKEEQTQQLKQETLYTEPIEALTKDSKYEEMNLPPFSILVELPSKGMVYSVDHPLHNKTHIEIKEVSGKEEKILANKDFIKSGIVVTNFIKSLLLSDELKKENNFDLICDADRSAILVAARISAFGEDYDAQITCPSCLKKDKYSFPLNKQKSSNGYFSLSDQSGVDFNETTGCFEFVLPVSKLKIATYVSNQKVICKIEKMTAVDKNVDFSHVFCDLVRFVNDMEPTTKQKMDLHDNLKSADLWHFKKTLKKIQPSFEIVSDWKCNHCEIEMEMDAPISSRFLYPEL